MDVEYVNSFILATDNVLKTMAFVTPKVGKAFVKKENEILGEATGVLGLANDTMKGSFAIAFSKKPILKIVSNMLGEKFEEINNEIIDAVGEITNMICGQARGDLSKKGINLNTGIPQMIQGKDYHLYHKIRGPILTIPFEIDEGTFWVEVCLIENHS